MEAEADATHRVRGDPGDVVLRLHRLEELFLFFNRVDSLVNGFSFHRRCKEQRKVNIRIYILVYLLQPWHQSTFVPILHLSFVQYILENYMYAVEMEAGCIPEKSLYNHPKDMF